MIASTHVARHTWIRHAVCGLAVLLLARQVVHAGDGWDPPLFQPATVESAMPLWSKGSGNVDYRRGFDFTPETRPSQFTNCPAPTPSWCEADNLANGVCCDLDQKLPANSRNNATWFASADLVPLFRDPRVKRKFAQRGLLVNTVTVLSSQDIDYQLDSGGQFTLGRNLGERLSVEGTYLGSYGWTDRQFVRNTDTNLLLGTGSLFSPFSNFGLPPQTGLDYNNFVQIDSSASLESAEINLRYRPDVPCGPWDVSFLYGVRYIHIDEFLRYHSESSLPTPGGSSATESVFTNNNMIGAQLGVAGHYLYSPRTWVDVDMRAALYSNRAGNRTRFIEVDETATTSTFDQNAGRNDTAFSGDIRIVWNYQVSRAVTLHTGYQATWIASVATAVTNFQNNDDLLRLGPGIIRTDDTVAYHGPVFGVEWVR